MKSFAKHSFFFFLCISLSSLLFLSSCKKEDEAENPQAKLRCKINDTQWNADAATAVILGGNLTITGTNTNGQIVAINLSSAQAGTYNLENLSSDLVSYTAIGGAKSFSNACVPAEGTIIISAIDSVNKTITGTFSAKVCSTDQTLSITNGVIDKVKY